jgi:hypothetical protein
MPTDKTCLSEAALGRYMIANDEVTKLSWKKQCVTRSQAVIKLQPIIGKFNNGGTVIDFTAEVETTFAEETVKVLPQADKVTIRIAAVAAGNNKVQEWIISAKEDLEEYTWEVAINVPKQPADKARAIFADFKTLAEASPPNIRNWVLTRAQSMEALFESYDQLVCNLKNGLGFWAATETLQTENEIMPEIRRPRKKRQRVHEEDQVEERTPAKRRLRGAPTRALNPAPERVDKPRLKCEEDESDGEI